MPVSYGEQHSEHCPECEREYLNTVWLIVDAGEQPEVWKRCRNLSVHCHQCPQGHAFRADAPLLLYDPRWEQLMFSASGAAGASRDRIAQELSALAGAARPALPRRVQKSMDKSLSIVSRDLLPLAMARPGPDVVAHIQYLYDLSARSAPLERSAICKAALKIVRREDAPMLWATFAGRMVTALRDLPFGDHRENLDEAIAISEEVLRELRTHGDPIRVAMAELNLGAALGSRSPADRSRAIALIQSARTVFRPRLSPYFCAYAANNAAIEFFKGGATSSEDTEAAIAALEEGIDAISMDVDPRLWGEMHQHLGVAFFRRLAGDRAENLERSIAAYEEALRARTVAAAPVEHVLTQMDLGNSLLVRVRGDRAENIEQAIHRYTAAAAIAEQNDDRFNWARLQYDLSYAYQLRIRGTDEENARNSVNAGLAATSVLTREQYPDDWGRVEHNLGNAYRTFARMGHDEEWARSIDAYRNALSVRSPDRNVADWLMTIDNLSGTYMEMPGAGEEHEREALALLEPAGRVDPQSLSPVTYARFLVNFGTFWRDRRTGDADGNRARAEEAFRGAIRLSSENGLYMELRMAALRLALMRVLRGEWERAYAELCAILPLVERQYVSSVTEAGKESEGESNFFLAQMLTDICLHTSRTAEAFVRWEEGCARVLRDELGAQPVPAPNAPLQLLDEESALLQRARATELALREVENAETRADLVDAQQHIRERLDAIWDELAGRHDSAQYVRIRRGDRASYEEIRSWLERQPAATALVMYALLRDRWIAFIVRADAAEPLVADIPLAEEALNDAVFAYTAAVRRPQSGGEPDRAGRHLGEALLAPVLPHLTGVEHVCIVPHGVIHYVPMHALEHEGQPLLARAAVSYAVSATIAARPGDATSKTKPPRAFVVGNPTGDLKFAEIEAATVARLTAATALFGRDATSERVLEGMRAATTVHLATHARFDAENPFASGMLLADRTLLRASDIMKETLQPDLLVLSACDTGVQKLRVSNSLAGLARGFLYAGARSLVLTMWPVNDLSTMFVMIRFYAGVQRGVRPLAALRDAQLWLRGADAALLADEFVRHVEGASESALLRSLRAMPPGQRPFAAPHHWAPFFVTGAA